MLLHSFGGGVCFGIIEIPNGGAEIFSRANNFLRSPLDFFIRCLRQCPLQEKDDVSLLQLDKYGHDCSYSRDYSSNCRYPSGPFGA